MKTIIVNVPDKQTDEVKNFFDKLHLRSRILTDEDFEDKVLAGMINEGMQTEDVPIEKVFEYLRKNGVDC
jgi:hypothetical protein